LAAKAERAIERKRDREIHTERERDIQRDSERQRDGKTERDRQPNRKTNSLIEIHVYGRHAGRTIDIDTDRQTHTHKQTRIQNSSTQSYAGL